MDMNVVNSAYLADSLLSECRIAKRGKGAKGSIEVAVFGIPNKDEEGIAKTFDYSFLKDSDLDVVIDVVSSKGLSIIECLARGADSLLKSATQAASSSASLLQARLKIEGLANDDKEAAKLALAASNLLTTGFIESLDEAIEAIRKMKEKNKVK